MAEPLPVVTIRSNWPAFAVLKLRFNPAAGVVRRVGPARCKRGARAIGGQHVSARMEPVRVVDVERSAVQCQAAADGDVIVVATGGDGAGCRELSGVR